MTAERPDIVLILTDQHRWDFVGWEPSAGTTRTPVLDGAAASGCRFRSAYCPAPLCSPARAAIALGRHGMNSGCYTNLHRIPADSPSFVRQLRDHGYRTCAVGKTHYEIHAYDSDLTSVAHARYMARLGWDETWETAGGEMFRTGIADWYSRALVDEGRLGVVLAHARRWRYFMDPAAGGDQPFTCHPWTPPAHLHPSEFVLGLTQRWIERLDERRPIFLQVGFCAPHSPISPLPRHLDLYAADQEPGPRVADGADPSLLAARQGYRALITHLDEAVGRLVDQLARLRPGRRTLFIYTADHGEMAGDHGRDGKEVFHEGSMRVPLLIWGPGIPARALDCLVETLDLGATICDLAGVPRHSLDQGQSLAPLLFGAPDRHRDDVYAEMGCDRMLRTARHKLMWGAPERDRRGLGRIHLDRPVAVEAAPPALFDLMDDPHETRDLAGDPALRGELLARLLARIDRNRQMQPFASRGTYRPLAMA